MVVVFILFLVLPTLVRMHHVKQEQIHLSFGDNPKEMVVTWSTFQHSRTAYVLYGKLQLTSKAVGKSHFYDNLNQYIHRVTITGLKYGTTYVYAVGNDNKQSKMYALKTSPAYDQPLKVIVFGDLGVENCQTLPYLIKETQKGETDFVIHVGDFAYDLHNNGGRRGDVFMRSIQDISANIPYMTCPGNREVKENFTHYKHRFTMPDYKRSESMFYSFNSGPVHFVALNEELYFKYESYGKHSLRTQYNWLRDDLAMANEKEQRSKRPWIILFGHHPLYCSALSNLCWSKTKLKIDNRIGINIEGKRVMGLEPLMKEFGVDLMMNGHIHAYERMLPVYDLNITKGNNPYKNPKATVFLTTGAAGNHKGTDIFQANPPSWSACRDSTYSYTRMTIFNSTHLYWEQVSVASFKTRSHYKPTVIDKVWIIQEKHGPF